MMVHENLSLLNDEHFELLERLYGLNKDMIFALSADDLGTLLFPEEDSPLWDAMLDFDENYEPLPDTVLAEQICDILRPANIYCPFDDDGAAKNISKIQKGWVTTEDGDHIYIDGGGSVSGGSAAYTQYQQDLSDGRYTPTSNQVGQEDANEENNQSQTASEVREALEKAGIEYKEVQTFNEQPSEEDIIDKIGGPDQTKGSCSSLAFAYMAQENGLDVLDYRDGESRAFFAKDENIKLMAEIEGIQSTAEVTYNEQKTAMKMLNNMEKDNTYYLAVGKHAAIVRSTNSGFEYLELQSHTDNGWHKLDKARLKSRFGATQSHSSHGVKYQTYAFMINSKSIKNNEEYRKVMGYINTTESGQKKGAGGYAK